LEIAIQLGKSFLPGNLKIAAIHGCLLGPIQIKELYYTDASTQLSISLAEFDWHWSSLLRAQLSLSPLYIDKLKLFIKENKQKKTESQQKTIPFRKVLKHLKFNSVDIQQINIRTDTVNFILQGSLHQQWHLNWQLNIAKIANSIPDLQGKLALQGKISGTRHHPEFYLMSQQTDLKWKDWQLKQIQTVLDIDTAKNKKWLLDVKIARLNNKTLTLTPLQLKLSGYLAPFSFQGSLSDFKLYQMTELNSAASAVIPRTQIKSHLSKYGLETTLSTKQGNKNQLLVHLLLPGYRATSALITPKQTLNTQIHLILKDFNLLSKFIPDLKNPQGLLDTEVNLVGPLSLPQINLSLNLQQASAKIPRLGLNLTHINIQLHTDKKNILIGIAHLNSGKGSLILHAKTQLVPQNFSTLIDLQGKNISIIDTPAYKITASPQLKIEANTQQIKTQGLIIVPKARIKINTQNSNSVGLTEDIEFVGDKKKSASFPFTFKNDIKIECGDDIQFQYQGLKTKLIGSLVIRQDADHPILATGQIKLSQGKYSYYGQALKLQPNSLLDFANTPIDNPKLNITASRKIWLLPKLSAPSTSTRIESKLGAANFIQSALQDSQPVPIQLDIGLHLRGSLQNPHIILFANPSNIIKSQLDMLSYLITGQASNQLSTASAQLLLHAVTNLSGGKNSNINQFINKAQQKIGLDQLTIGAKPIFDPTSNSLQQNTSLIIGKSLSPKLNVSYSLGLLNAINILEINYILNKNFSLQSTNSNFANGIDLLYRLEKY
jgi:autotransporter translocation and assembly factor TamB